MAFMTSSAAVRFLSNQQADSRELYSMHYFHACACCPFVSHDRCGRPWTIGTMAPWRLSIFCLPSSSSSSASSSSSSATASSSSSTAVRVCSFVVEFCYWIISSSSSSSFVFVVPWHRTCMSSILSFRFPHYIMSFTTLTQ